MLKAIISRCWAFLPITSTNCNPSTSLVYGPMKTYINQASDSCMREKDNASKVMTIHRIPKLVAYVFPKAMTTENIWAGFKVTGIYPYDRNIFSDNKFLSYAHTQFHMSSWSCLSVHWVKWKCQQCCTTFSALNLLTKWLPDQTLLFPPASIEQDISVLQ